MRVSVVALPTRVSDVVGKVIVPVLVIVEITGDAENVATPEIVCAPESVPESVAPLIVGAVSVKPATVVTVAPEVRAVDPNVIVEYPDETAQKGALVEVL